jgi:parallel beta-helix repeat protein
MFRTSRLCLLAVTVAVGLHAPSLMAYSVAVGPASCMTALPHYPTIQSAVSAVPPFATVIVCPGTYPEQVVISQPMTLQGLVAGAEIITVPASGLVGNTPSTYYGTLAAQLLAANTSGVTVKDIIVDGTGSKCPSGATYVTGIVFYKVGVPADVNSGGTIQNMVVRNVYPSNCYGEGIWSDTSYITIVGNDVHDLNNSGVYAAVGNNSIVSNNIARLGFATYLDSASGTTISGNTSFGTSYGSVLNGSSIILTKNSMVNTFYGVYMYNVNNGTITQNKISGSYNGVLMYGVKSTTVQANIINNSNGTAIHVDDFGSAGGNTIKGNTILETPCGLSQGSAIGDVLSPNTLLGVVATTCP